MNDFIPTPESSFCLFISFCIYFQSHCIAYNVSISICEHFSPASLIKISSIDNTTLPHPVNALLPYPFFRCPSLGPPPPHTPHLTFTPITCVCTTVSQSVSVIECRHSVYVKWGHTMSLLHSLPHSAVNLPYFSTFCQKPEFCWFLWLSSIPLCATVFQSIPPYGGIWVGSIT